MKGHPTDMKEDFIPFALPFMGEDEKDAVKEVLEKGWLTTGPKTREFEEAFSAFTGARHAVAVNSCTAALHLALEAIGLREGDEVITTPYTFAATAEVIRYFNARPVFIDIEPETMNISPGKIEEAKGRTWTPGRAKAIIPVHFAGLPCDMDEILGIARENGLKVIEDAAHALPCRYRGKMVGSIGDMTCFSFYATKTITTGEGGMVTTDNDEWADRMRVMSLHGISRDAWKRYTREGSWYYEITAPGFKYNLTDIASALGIAQLRKAFQMNEARARIAAYYDGAFKDEPCLELPPRTNDPLSTHSNHLYVIRLVLDRLDITRDAFIEGLKENGIGASVHFIPLHVHPYYRDTYGFKPEDFPNSHGSYKRAVSLPIYPGLSARDMERVAGAVKAMARRHAR